MKYEWLKNDRKRLESLEDDWLKNSNDGAYGFSYSKKALDTAFSFLEKLQDNIQCIELFAFPDANEKHVIVIEFDVSNKEEYIDVWIDYYIDKNLIFFFGAAYNIKGESMYLEYEMYLVIHTLELQDAAIKIISDYVNSISL